MDFAKDGALGATSLNSSTLHYMLGAAEGVSVLRHARIRLWPTADRQGR